MRLTILDGPSECMIQCWCGEMFRGSASTSAELNLAITAWQEFHKDCKAPEQTQEELDLIRAELDKRGIEHS